RPAVGEYAEIWARSRSNRGSFNPELCCVKPGLRTAKGERPDAAEDRRSDGDPHHVVACDSRVDGLEALDAGFEHAGGETAHGLRYAPPEKPECGRRNRDCSRPQTVGDTLRARAVKSEWRG